MSDTELEALARHWARQIRWVPMAEPWQGAWSAGTRIIYLNDGLSDVQARCVLAHEISHARHGDTACMAGAWTERRADMDAARMLVNPASYAMAERIYEGDQWRIAQELGVMPWVVDAYRTWLHDHIVICR